MKNRLETEMPGESLEYRGFRVIHRKRAWHVYAMDGEKVSAALASKDDAMQFIDRHIRRGGK